MGNLRLEELSASTALAANKLTLRRGQEQFVVPPSYAIADAYLDPTTSWPRVVLKDDKVVGFIRGNFDQDSSEEEFRSCVWRVHVSADEQGQGVGTFAVLALADEARQRGFSRLTALWEPGDDGPEAFFTNIGFVVERETQYGEKFGVLTL
jgi:diamine N-acetyltransferase